MIHSPVFSPPPSTLISFEYSSLALSATLTLSRTLAGALIMAEMMSATFSLVIGRIYAFSLAAAAMKAGSAMVLRKAARSAATRSAGTPGVVANGRPTVAA